MTIPVDIRVPVGAPIKETAAFIRRCEAAGFGGVGVIDHQHSGRDVYVTLAAAAMATSRIFLYPAVTNPITRHAMVLACLAHSLEELAPRRIILPVGAGFMSMRHINRRPASVNEMRAAITAIRRLLRGESVYPGITEGKMTRTTNPPTPVYVTATGPRMAELAGEVGDGAVLMVSIHPKAVAKARQLMAQGARRSGQDASKMPIVLVCGGRIAKDVKSAQEWAREFCYRWTTDPIRSYWLKEAGIDLPKASNASQLPEQVLAQICEATGLFGPPEYWVERIKQIGKELGASRLFVQPDTTYDMPADTVEAFQKHVAPRL